MTPTRTSSSATPHAPGPATALIPLRTGGKSRLRGTLDDRRRGDLVLAMLDDVLAALRTAGVVDMRVLAGDIGAASAAATRGLEVVLDPGPAVPADARPRDDTPASLGGPTDAAPGDVSLRRAVDAGLVAVGDDTTRIVVAADLPLLRAVDIRTVLESATDVTVAPTRGGGTALLRLGRGIVIPARYGPGSAAAHIAAAAERGFSVDEIDLPGARSDVDGAADLRALDVALEAARDAGDGPADVLLVGHATASFLAAPRG